MYVLDTLKVLRAFARTNGQVRWQRSLPGSGVIADMGAAAGVVVLAAGPLIGVDAATGTPRWEFESPEGAGILQMTVSDSLTYPSSDNGTGGLVAIGTRSGAQRWRSSVIHPDTVVLSSDQVRVFGPVLEAGSLAASFVMWRGTVPLPRGGVSLLDANTGALKWSRVLPVVSPTVSTFPSRAAIGSGVVVTSSQEGFVYAYDQQSGTLRWTAPPAMIPLGSSGSVAANPDRRPVAVSGQFVVAGSGYGMIDGYDLASGAKRWTFNSTRGAVMSFSTDLPGYLLAYHLTGSLTLFESATGKVRWQWLPRSAAERFYDPRMWRDTVYAASTEGGVWALKVP